MNNRKRAGFFRRTLAAIGDSLVRGISGKSATAYMKQFSGDDEYWDRVIAGRRGRNGEVPVVPGPEVSA